MKNKHRFLSKCTGFSNYIKVILNKSRSGDIPRRFMLYKSVLLLHYEFLYPEMLQRRTVKWIDFKINLLPTIGGPRLFPSPAKNINIP